MEAPVDSGADARPVPQQVPPHILVRSALGGEREWLVLDVHGDLTARALKQHLVTHGGVSRLDQPVLLAGARPLQGAETVRTVLADSGEGHVTLVRCDRSWLADERTILAGKYLKAFLDGVLSDGSPRFDPKWLPEDAPEVSPEELEELVQHALCEEDLAHEPDPSVEEFLILLGTELQSYGDSELLSLRLCYGRYYNYDFLELPGMIVRCNMHWALVFATPGEVEASWPLVRPVFSNGRASKAMFYRPPGCSIGARLGEGLEEALRRIGSLPAEELERIDRARFIEDAGAAPLGGPTLAAHTALAALRVRTRLAAGLPVVLLGEFPKCEDVEVCQLARHLLPSRHKPGLSMHEVAELPGDFLLLTETLVADGERPLTLLRARGDVQDTRRLAQLAAAVGGWSPRTVWSLSTCGTTRERVLRMLPRACGEAAAICL